MSLVALIMASTIKGCRNPSRKKLNSFDKSLERLNKYDAMEDSKPLFKKSLQSKASKEKQNVSETRK